MPTLQNVLDAFDSIGDEVVQPMALIRALEKAGFDIDAIPDSMTDALASRHLVRTESGGIRKPGLGDLGLPIGRKKVMNKLQNLVAQSMLAGFLLGVNITGLLAANRHSVLFVIGLILAVAMIVLVVLQAVQYVHPNTPSRGSLNAAMKQWLADVAAAKEKRGQSQLTPDEESMAIQGYEAGWIGHQKQTGEKS